MNLLDAAAILLLAGYGTVEPFDAGELDEAAFWLVQACDVEAGAEPTGDTCIAITAAILAHETAGTFVPYSTGKWVRSGQGPVGIVQPRECFRNTRIGVRCFGPEELLGGASNIAAAVEILRWKYAKTTTMRGRIEAFNGSSGKARYADVVLRTLRDVGGYDEHALGIYRAIEAAR